MMAEKIHLKLKTQLNTQNVYFTINKVVSRFWKANNLKMAKNLIKILYLSLFLRGAYLLAFRVCVCIFSELKLFQEL